MVPNSGVMTVAAILKCRLLKIAATRKIHYIFVIKLKLQVYGIKISTFLKNGDEDEVVQCPFNGNFNCYVSLCYNEVLPYKQWIL